MEGEIIFNIDVMLAKRKMKLGDLAEKVGITPANMSILKTGKAKAIRISTLVKLCDALIEAQIYLDSDWSKIYPRVASVLHDGSLKLDMRQTAIDNIMEYIGLYEEYVH